MAQAHDLMTTNELVSDRWSAVAEHLAPQHAASVDPVLSGLSQHMQIRARDVTIDGAALDHLDGILVLVNKPCGLVCSHEEREGPNVYSLLPPQWALRRPQVISVGRYAMVPCPLALDRVHLPRLTTAATAFLSLSKWQPGMLSTCWSLEARWRWSEVVAGKQQLATVCTTPWRRQR